MPPPWTKGIPWDFRKILSISQGFLTTGNFFNLLGFFGAFVGFLVVTSLVIPLTELYVAYNFRGLRISEHEQFMDYRLKITYEWKLTNVKWICYRIYLKRHYAKCGLYFIHTYIYDDNQLISWFFIFYSAAFINKNNCSLYRKYYRTYIFDVSFKSLSLLKSAQHFPQLYTFRCSNHQLKFMIISDAKMYLHVQSLYTPKYPV